MNYRIILGLGDEALTDKIRSVLEDNGVGEVVSIALTRKNILKQVSEKDADMVLVSEYLVGEEESDEEWLEIVEELKRISLNIRFVFFCERPENDLFLTKLTLLGVTDIFNEGKFPRGWEAQLKNPPRYEHGERFRKLSEPILEEIRKPKKKEAEVTPEEILKQDLRPVESKPQIIEKRVVEKQIVIEQLKVPSRTVAVVSLFPSAGSSMLTRILAEYIASFQVDVGVLESATIPPAWFELINAYERVNDTEWQSWHQTIVRDQQQPAWSETIEADRVKYIVRRPTEHYERWTETNTAHMLAYSRNMSVLFVDVSTNFTDPREEIVLRSADVILLVGGYDAVRMNRSSELYKEHLQKYQDKIIHVMNKSTRRLERIHRNEITMAFETKALFDVPAFVELMEIYMEAESFWSTSFVKEEQRQLMRSAMDKLAVGILGEEVMKKLHSRTRKGIFSRIGEFFTQGDDVDVDDETA